MNTLSVSTPVFDVASFIENWIVSHPMEAMPVMAICLGLLVLTFQHIFK